MELETKILEVIRGPKLAALATLTICSGKDLIPEDLTKPYVVIKGKAELIDDQETKNRFWNPYLENHFNGINDPEYGLLKFVPNSIEYYHENTVNVWAK
jgi:hypothetical protein